MLAHLLKGLLVGISIAAPIGPIGILCIRRTLLGGRRAGYIAGLGAATAHVGFGLLTLLGLSALSHFILQHQFWFHLLGGLYLCSLGFRLVRKRNLLGNDHSTKQQQKSSGYFSSLIITGTNPMTLVTFVTLLTEIGSAELSLPFAAKSLIILGIFISSSIWWLFLCRLTHTLRHRISKRSLIWLHRFSGVALTLIGLLLIGNM